MAARRPACALLHAHGVIRAPDAKLAADHLLKMTFQTEIRVARGKHLGVHRAVCAVTRGATFVRRLMLEDMRAALSWMTFQTRLILRLQRRSASKMRRAFVRRMTFDAGHSPFGNGMVARQIELAAHLRMAGEANGFTRM